MLLVSHNHSESESDLFRLISLCNPFMGKNRLDKSFALFRAHCIDCLEVVQELLVPMKKELVQKPTRLDERVVLDLCL